MRHALSERIKLFLIETMNLLVRIVVVAIVVIVFLLVSLYLLSGSNLLERIECPSCDCDCSGELQSRGQQEQQEHKMEEQERASEAIEAMRALMQPVSLHTIIEEDVRQANAIDLRIEEVDNESVESEGLPENEPIVEVLPLDQVMVGANAGDSETLPST